MSGLHRFILCACLSWAACGTPESTVQAPVGESETWYGAYLGGQKIGYLRKKVSKTPDGGVRLYSENFISAKSLDRPISLRTIETLEASVEFVPERYFQKIDAGAGPPSTVRGKRTGGRFDIRVESGGRRIKEKSFAIGDLTFPQLADQLVRAEELAVGKSWTFPIINPVDFLPMRITISVDKAVPQFYKGELKNALRVTAKLGAIEFVSYVDTLQPEPFRIEWPSMGLEYILEDKKTAEQISRAEPAELDLAYFAAVVPTGGTLPPDAAGRVRVRLQGAAFDDLTLEGDFQRVQQSTKKMRLIEISQPDRNSLDDSPPMATSEVDTEPVTPEILQLAATFSQPGPLAFSRAAIDWMQANIRQVPTSFVPSAADVLDLRQGDCNEFSALFHALCAAAGFPCKIISGVVYMDGKYFYHSWNEIRAGGRWVPVDPILNEIPASPKHIKLIESNFVSASWRLAGCLRTLKIEILPN